MTAIAQPVNGQDINLAAQATRKALEVVLAEQGTTFAPLAALNTIGARGAALDTAALVGTLAGGLQVEEQAVLTILHGLAARGLVRRRAAESDGYELTDAGAAEQQRIAERVGNLTAQLYAGLDPEDLATTRRVLVTLTDRATTYLAAALLSP
jgi:DNA-binding MarR family transcriptional regulator